MALLNNAFLSQSFIATSPGRVCPETGSVRGRTCGVYSRSRCSTGSCVSRCLSRSGRYAGPALIIPSGRRSPQSSTVTTFKLLLFHHSEPSFHRFEFFFCVVKTQGLDFPEFFCVEKLSFEFGSFGPRAATRSRGKRGVLYHKRPFKLTTCNALCVKNDAGDPALCSPAAHGSPYARGRCRGVPEEDPAQVSGVAAGMAQCVYEDHYYDLTNDD